MMVFAFMTSRLGAPNNSVKLAEATPNVLGVRLAYMETWNQRLRQARLARGFDNLTAFARSLGVKAPTAHNWESGATKELKGQNLINVCQKLQITHQWLLDGKGNMDDGLPATIEATTKVQMSAVIPPGAGVAVWEKLSDLPAGGAAYVQVPHYDVEVSAGDGCVWHQHTDNDPLVFRARFFSARGLKPEHCKGLYVRGESMVPTLKDGDTVLINTAATSVRDDAVYAVLYHGELYVKRLFRLPGGGVELRSDNPRHPSREIQGADLEHLIILGEMVWRAG